MCHFTTEFYVNSLFSSFMIGHIVNYPSTDVLFCSRQKETEILHFRNLVFVLIIELIKKFVW